MKMIKSLVVSAFLLALMTPATIYADGHASPAVEAAIDALKDHIDNHVGEGQLDDQDKDGLKDFAKSLEEAARGEHQEGGCENCAGDVMTEISDWTSNLEWSDGQDQGEFVMALMDLYSDLENAIHQEENESHEGEHHEGQGPTFADVDTDQDGVISEDEASEAFGHEDDFEEKFAEVDSDGDGEITSEEFYAASPPGGEGEHHEGEYHEGEHHEGEHHEGEHHEGEHHEGQGPTFADVDTDQDGVISEDEASEAFGHEDDFEEKFAEVDSDGDGEITSEEFYAASPPGGEGGAPVVHQFHHIAGDDHLLDENEASAAYPDSEEGRFEELDQDGNGTIDSAEYYDAVADGMRDFQEEGVQPIASWGDWTLHNCAALCAGLESIPDENDAAVSVEQGQENGCPCAQTGPPPSDY